MLARPASTDRRRVRAPGGGGADALPDGRLSVARGVDRGSAKRASSGGADLLELGVPYSDPLADGPVIHEAGTRALAGGRERRRRARGRAGARAERPGRVDVLREHGLRARRRGVSSSALPERRVRADRARPAARGGAAGARAHATRAGLRWCRWSRRRRHPSGLRRSARARAASSTRCRSSARPASGPRCRSASPRS